MIVAEIVTVVSSNKIFQKNNRHSFGFQKCKQQMESMSEQSVLK